MAEKNQQFSVRLVGLLKQSGMTQKALAERVGVRNATVNNYCKSGRVPEWNILVKIAQLLDVSCDWLLTGKGFGGITEGEGRAIIRLPRGRPRLSAGERKLLEDVLEVLGADGPSGEYTKMIKQAVKAGKLGVAAQRKIVEPRSRKAKVG